MKWHIRSSSGRNLMSVEFIGQRKNKEGEKLLISRVEIQGLFWSYLDEEFRGEVIEDFTALLHQVVFHKNQLEAFLWHVNAWLQQPEHISLDLSSGLNSCHKFNISIGKSEEIISSTDHPVCTIEFSSGVFKLGKWSFVVDHSCISLLAEELSEALRNSQGYAGKI
jgi:hypothetical protein